jgi:hypothetical protein
MLVPPEVNCLSSLFLPVAVHYPVRIISTNIIQWNQARTLRTFTHVSEFAEGFGGTVQAQVQQH